MLKHPDGQKPLEVISNSISIDYVVHHWLRMLHKPLPFLLHMPLNYPFEEVKSNPCESSVTFLDYKNTFFYTFHGKKRKSEIRQKERKS